MPKLFGNRPFGPSTGEPRPYSFLVVVAWVVGAVHQSGAQVPNLRATIADTGVLAPFPGDSAALRGQLPNGLRFVVRPDRLPAHRAELRLVVDAGSVVEDDDQPGLAHFVEHMAFAGTQHFPQHALIDYLELLGLRFGADLNAETGLDQTVYRLTVPTDSVGVLNEGLAVLADWANAVTFDSNAVVAERGVVQAEWRIRTGGGVDAGPRIRARVDSTLYPGTHYPDRQPLGLPRVIETATPALLKRFYRDWYRPDLMAVIVVGDFDRAAVVRRIRQLFTPLRNPVSERPRPPRGMPRWTGPRVALVADSAQHGAYLQLLFRLPPDTGDAPTSTRLTVLENMVYNSLASRAKAMEVARAPVQMRPVSSCQTHGGGHCLALEATVAAEQSGSGAAVLLTEIGRLAQQGPTPDELAFAQQMLRAGLDWPEEVKGSAEWAGDYVDYAFAEEPYVPGVVREPIARALLAQLTPTDLAAFVRTYCTPEALVLIEVGPTGAAGGPTAEALRAVIDSVSRAALTPPPAPPVPRALSALHPDPGRIASARQHRSVGIVEWTLGNGMRVLLKPTAAAGAPLLIRAVAPGGASLAPDTLWAAAAVSASVTANVLGWDGVHPDELGQELFDVLGTAAKPRVEILTDVERVDIAGPASYAELLFKLLHLAFQIPRADTAAFNRWKAGLATERAMSDAMAQVVRSRDLNAQASAVLDELLTSGNRRASTPRSDELRTVGLEDVRKFYEDRFGDASHFTVLIVGALTAEQARPLVERYLASLPTRGEGRERPRPLQIDFPAGVIRRAMDVLATPEAVTVLAFHGSLPRSWTPEAQNRLQALMAALQIELTTQLRERMGGTYGVQIALTFPELAARPGYVAQVRFESTPERADTLASVAVEVVRNFQQGHVSATVASQVGETTRRYSEMAYDAENGPWLERLTTRLDRGWPLDDIPRVDAHSTAFTPQGIAATARQYLDLKNYVQVTLLPKGYAQPARDSTSR